MDRSERCKGKIEAFRSGPHPGGEGMALELKDQEKLRGMRLPAHAKRRVI